MITNKGGGNLTNQTKNGSVSDKASYKQGPRLANGPDFSPPAKPPSIKKHTQPAAPAFSAEHIKKLREVLNLTQVGLANKIGTTRVTISRWENGKTRPLPIFLRLMGALLDSGMS